MSLDAKRLLGTWELVTWDRTGADGQVSYPYTERATGRIFYDPGGLMGAFLMHPDWGPDDDGTEPRFLSYSGRWMIEGDIVNHTVDMASDPRFIGLTLRRRMVPDGERIALVTLASKGRAERDSQHRLLWRRPG